MALISPKQDLHGYSLSGNKYERCEVRITDERPLKTVITHGLTRRREAAKKRGGRSEERKGLPRGCCGLIRKKAIIACNWLFGADLSLLHLRQFMELMAETR